MKITIKQLRNIIKEAMHNYPDELRDEQEDAAHYEQMDDPEFQRKTDIESAYEEGFEQGRHDAIEQMGEAEVMRHMFDSQEVYNAFVDGYEDGYYG